ncbi:hypothetical protein HPB50_010744 [Hyalomma asiaticum]|uniref:Uncharacterized protein n=1 Tax=Hyalomma asiaticum TaxID=266040 RepID=A0ACB7TBM7_HYAAI|nr:hypothetical protein HPB50_010744 [Hyalomma asiaticum]
MIKEKRSHAVVATDRLLTTNDNVRLRPDLVVEEGNQVTIIDFAVTWDANEGILIRMCAAKRTKYAALKEVFPGRQYQFRHWKTTGRQRGRSEDRARLSCLAEQYHQPQCFLGSPIGFRIFDVGTTIVRLHALLNARARETLGRTTSIPVSKTDWRCLDDVLRLPIKKMLTRYVGGAVHDEFRTASSQLRSTWTEACKASRRLNNLWELDPEAPRITCDSSIISSSSCRTVVRSLGEVLLTARDRVPQERPTQGKFMQSVAAELSSAHFMRISTHTNSADWRFSRGARPSLLNLNGACMWASLSCNQRSRNHTFCNTNLTPDLVLVAGEEAILLDVACPFDNGPDAFAEARLQKIAKYQPMRQHLSWGYHRGLTRIVGYGERRPRATLLPPLLPSHVQAAGSERGH